MQLLFFAAITVAVTAPLALGFALAYRVGGLFHLALGGLFTAAAYSAIAVPSWPLGSLAGLTTAIVLGAAIEVECYRPLRARRTTPGGLLVVSLGIYVIIEAFLALVFGHRLVTLWPELRDGFVLVGKLSITHAQLLALLLGPVSVGTLLVLLSRSTLGRSIEAVSDDPELAQAVGIEVERVRLIASILAALLAGLAGMLVAIDVGVRPSSGFRPLMFAIVATVVGGATPSGTVLASVFVGLVFHLSVLVFPASPQDAILFTVLAAALIAHPRGMGAPVTARAGDR